MIAFDSAAGQWFSQAIGKQKGLATAVRRVIRLFLRDRLEFDLRPNQLGERSFAFGCQIHDLGRANAPTARANRALTVEGQDLLPGDRDQSIRPKQFEVLTEFGFGRWSLHQSAGRLVKPDMRSFHPPVRAARPAIYFHEEVGLYEAAGTP